MRTTPNSSGPADPVVWLLVGVSRCGIEIKTDTWTASIVDLSYTPVLSRLSRLDVLAAISAARLSTGGGPGMGRGGISREGGCESEDCDEFGRSLMRALPSTVIAVGSGIGPANEWADGIGMSGVVLFGFLT